MSTPSPSPSPTAVAERIATLAPDQFALIVVAAVVLAFALGFMVARYA